MIRANLPQVSLSCDVIVGFPGETDEEFEERWRCAAVWVSRVCTCSAIASVPVPLAADMPDQVPPEVMAERSRRMRAAAQELALLPTLVVARARSSVRCSSMATT